MFIKSALERLFGTHNERFVKSLHPLVRAINDLEDEYIQLSDEQLRAKTTEFKDRYTNGETLDALLVESFAAVREAGKRVLNMRHFDVQLMGGIVLHQGKISEMKTGEGKTLVATLAAYLNALNGKGVHLVTTNDYLAKRDSEWMGQIFRFLGMSVGCIHSEISEEDRRAAYSCDILYGTNNEFGFDFLRDNLKYDLHATAQREFNFAIVDEVDSILIDEARTPLIISGPTDDNSDLYRKINTIVDKLQDSDFEIDEKARTVYITDSGNDNIEAILKQLKIMHDDSSLYEVENISILHHLNQMLKAHKIFHKDVDYIIKDKKVMIVDEFTGRVLDGRRYSEGLHQAIEAKEGVPIQNENQTLASITFQNYFRMYPKLAGMTGTAMTEAQEFSDIYKLDVVAIPTHMPVTRVDENDEVYLTADEKYAAILADIEAAHKRGQPVLVGTVSIEKSEFLAKELKKRKIPHNILNARYHEQEAYIIAQAGRYQAVTIATNMAGRGTDIKLGGSWEMMLSENKNAKEDAVKRDVEENKQKVLEVGGLYVIGTERHESRRIDNQLRGRAGRQGDPGRTKFYLSMEDDLMRIFGSDKIKGLLSKLGLKPGEAIVHPWINRSLEKAQQKVEARNYDIRKTLLRFDDVMNEQRKVIYAHRNFYLEDHDFISQFTYDAEEVLASIVPTFIPPNSLPEQWDLEAMSHEIHRIFNLKVDFAEFAKIDGSEEEIITFLKQGIAHLAKHKEEMYSKAVFNNAIQNVFVITLDQLWKEHLYALDHLRTGIGLRSYAQKDPLNEYKIEAFRMFEMLLKNFQLVAISRICFLEITHAPERVESNASVVESRLDPALIKSMEPALTPSEAKFNTSSGVVKPEDRDPNDPSTWGKISRNDLCPCGSGKKYKQCHGVI